MEIEKFIENYREAFGEAAGLPVVFWYSDEETGHTEKIGGCFFKGMQVKGEIQENSRNGKGICR